MVERSVHTRTVASSILAPATTLFEMRTDPGLAETGNRPVKRSSGETRVKRGALTQALFERVVVGEAGAPAGEQLGYDCTELPLGPVP